MAAALSGLVLAGVLGAFVFIVQTGQRAAGYSSLEVEVRRGLEVFARDARAAVGVRWEDAQRLRLVLPGAGPPEVLYAYDRDPGSATFRSFYRQELRAAGAGPRQVLVRGLAPDFAFRRYRLAVAGGEAAPAANDLETKQLQLVFRAHAAPAGGGAGASQAAISARYVLRNKKVSN